MVVNTNNIHPKPLQGRRDSCRRRFHFIVLVVRFVRDNIVTIDHSFVNKTEAGLMVTSGQANRPH